MRRRWSRIHGAKGGMNTVLMDFHLDLLEPFIYLKVISTLKELR